MNLYSSTRIYGRHSHIFQQTVDNPCTYIFSWNFSAARRVHSNAVIAMRLLAVDAILSNCPFAVPDVKCLIDSCADPRQMGQLELYLITALSSLRRIPPHLSSPP